MSLALRFKMMNILLVVIVGGCAFGCRNERADTPSIPTNSSDGVKSIASGTDQNLGTQDAEREPTKPTIRFEMMGEESGLNHIFRDGHEAEVYSIVESLGGGVSIIDFDCDGLADVLCPGGGKFMPRTKVEGCRGDLLRGRASNRFVSVAEFARVDMSAYYHHAAIVGDYDNDGFDDFVVTGYGGLQLFRNQGDGTFEEVANAAQLDDPLWSSTAAWCDIDGDGLLDLYVAHYANWNWENDPACIMPRLNVRDVCGPREFEALSDHFYFNNGNGTFRDATESVGLARGGRGLGVLAADLDGDGDVDLFVANDEQANFLYRNDGGVFSEMGIRAGVAFDESGSPDGSMGIAFGDFNRDGYFDLFVSHYENETFALFRSLGKMNFAHSSRSTNITSMGNRFVGWGTVFADLNLNGFEDILVVNGHAVRQSSTAPVEQRPVLLENQSGRIFQWIRSGAGDFLEQPRPARGLAMVDWNRDGLLDAVVSSVEKPVVGLINQSERQGHWIGIELIGTKTNRNAIGTTIVVESGDKRWYRQIIGGGSYASSSTRSLIIGLGQIDEVDRLSIRWPNSEPAMITSPKLNQYLMAIEK